MIRGIPSRIRSVLVALCSVLALAMGMALFPAEARAKPSELTITQQPEDVEVEYPLGVSFHVEVSDPDQVSSYQWIISDTYSDFVLEGSSASTDTLVIPSTQQDDPDLYARCVITGKDGTVLESESGMLHVTNAEEDKTVLYVGDIAVQPGDTLDLSETDFGSGLITFDADGVTITFENADFSIEGMTYDRTLSPSLGIFFSRRHRDCQEFFFNLIGENVFYNDYFDPDYNAAGVVFNIFFGSGDDEEPPTVCIQGEGSLTLKGGGNSIYSDADLRIDAVVTTEPNGSIYCDAITAQNITIGPNAELSLSCNGTESRSQRIPVSMGNSMSSPWMATSPRSSSSPKESRS